MFAAIIKRIESNCVGQTFVHPPFYICHQSIIFTWHWYFIEYYDYILLKKSLYFTGLKGRDALVQRRWFEKESRWNDPLNTLNRFWNTTWVAVSLRRRHPVILEDCLPRLLPNYHHHSFRLSSVDIYSWTKHEPREWWDEVRFCAVQTKWLNNACEASDRVHHLSTKLFGRIVFHIALEQLLRACTGSHPNNR